MRLLVMVIALLSLGCEKPFPEQIGSSSPSSPQLEERVPGTWDGLNDWAESVLVVE